MLLTRSSHLPGVQGMRTGWDSVACETHQLMCMVCGALPGTTCLDEDMREPVVLARGEGGGAGRALKGLPPAGLEGTFEIARSLPHGHVAAVLGTIRELGLKELIDAAGSRPRDLVTAMITGNIGSQPRRARAPSRPR